MCKKLTYSTSFALVLSVVLSCAANAADPSLVGWWRLDESSGTTAYDSSGKGNNGTLHGNPQWETGMIGGALHFDDASSDYVEIPFSEHLRVLNQGDFTHAAWVNFDEVNRKQQILMQGNLGGLGRPSFFITASGAVQSWLGGGGTYSGVNLVAEQWYHLAVVVTEGGAVDSIQLYVDGEGAGNPGQRDMESCEGVYLIGRHKANQNEFMDGLVDDVRMYNRALTNAEIQDVMSGAVMTLALASKPAPADGATDVPSDVVLSWTPGAHVTGLSPQHKVFFSGNFDDVNDGIGGVTQDPNIYPVDATLDFSRTYYWRVDEANSTTGWDQGSVWQFTVEPVAYALPSEKITATASSSNSPNEGPENTVNGSGLDADDLHSMLGTDMWLSSGEPLGAWIQYEFDKVYKLHEMWVWNSNQMVELLVGFGLKDVTIKYSADGTDWMELSGVPEFARGTGAAGYAHNTTVDFGGAAAKYIKIIANSNWAGMLPQYGLSEVRFFHIPVHAREPNPDSGTTDVPIGTIDEPVDVTLSWRAGRDAAQHNVYLSTDEQAVTDGTVAITTVTEASHGPLSLDIGQTYYWRVDEVNEAETPPSWQGDIWNFATQGYFVLDDFEDYNDYPPDEIFSTWIDGWDILTNGALAAYAEPPFVETMIVHSGSQAMPYFYDNSVGYSEAAVTLSSQRRDWTIRGIGSLSLWFRGYPASFSTFTEGPPGTYTITARSGDAWGQMDEFHYVYRILSGAGSVVARVESATNTSNSAKIGVMIRDTLDPDSKHAFMFIRPDGGVRFNRRVDVPGYTLSSAEDGLGFPHWLKLERDGAGNFAAFHSADGITWVPVNDADLGSSDNIQMNNDVYMGLAVCSNNTEETCEGVFSNVQVTGAVSPQWISQDVGILSNAPEPMYVALGDTGGTRAVVYHDDPNATQIGTWTEWNIDLKGFADQGVNLRNVDQLSIGFGDRDNPQVGTSGKMYFDDLGLYPLR